MRDVRIVAFLFFLPLLVSPASEKTAGPSASPASRGGGGLVDAIRGLEGRSLPEAWAALEEIKKTFQEAEAVSPLADGVYGLGETPRLLAAALLFGRRERSFSEKGQVVLQELAREAKDKGVRIAAIRILRKPVQTLWDPAYRTLKSIVDTSPDVEIRIEACQSLLELDNRHSVRLPLIRFLEDKDPATRYAAALALAESGYVQAPVMEILARLRQEPSERGRRAELLIRLADRETRRSETVPAPPNGDVKSTTQRPDTAVIDDTDPALRSWLQVVEEVVQTIRRNSIRRQNLRLRDLFVAALKGMVESIDEYSSFQDPDDVQQVEATRLGHYLGLGAQLAKAEKEAPLVVVKSYSGGPAYLAGIRSGDRILEVNGVPTRETSLEEVKRLTAGRMGDDVYLLVRHWDEKTPVRITVKRGEVEIPSITAQSFPENIGYIKILRFGPGCAGEFEKLLDGLEAGGLNALIIDLRDNPGGSLDQAVRIVDLFIGERAEPIVTEEEPVGRRERFSSDDQRPHHPMFILVNRYSASAAEVVAGALQDFRRAVIIGQPTFGKGVKQTSLPLSQRASALLGGESKLLLTTGYLYLPLGRPLQAMRDPGGQERRGGVEPDIVAGQEEERYDEKTIAEITRVQYAELVDEYILKNRSKIKNLYDEGDLWDPAQDNGFEGVYKALGTALSRSKVRNALRAVVRRRLEEESGEEPSADYRDDVQIQRAILEALRSLGRDPREIAAYRFLIGRIGQESRQPE